MRSDMHKVIVERPRWGHHTRNPSVIADRQRRVDDEAPKQAPMRPRRHPRKMLNENLAPLLRFLARRVGRPWDRVYAEIRAELSPRSAVQMHIHQHLFDYVRLHVRLEGHQVMAHQPAWSSGRPLHDDGRTFYVHPATGLLCRPKLRPPRARRAEPTP